MLRRLSPILSAASLVLFVGSCGLWVLAPVDLVRRGTGSRTYLSASAFRGAIEVEAADRRPAVGDTFGASRKVLVAGIRVSRSDGVRPPNRSVRARVPVAWVAAASVVCAAA
ncbi:MAG: hypothetical protein JWO31_652 [Phycisphaerales bacterium]|nr:hypothetical protein [Phycisphaerales bacterium]